MPRLSEEDYKATMPGKANRAPLDDSPRFDFWPYFEAIPEVDFEGHDCSTGAVDIVYRFGSGRWEHVLISSEDRNVFMVLVLDLTSEKVHGHHLLNLNKLYGLEPPHS